MANRWNGAHCTYMKTLSVLYPTCLLPLSLMARYLPRTGSAGGARHALFSQTEKCRPKWCWNKSVLGLWTPFALGGVGLLSPSEVLECVVMEDCLEDRRGCLEGLVTSQAITWCHFKSTVHCGCASM